MFLQKIEIENLLSFKHLDLDLRPLNVLIGANASGKSNLIRAFALLRSLPDKNDFLRITTQTATWQNRRTSTEPRIRISGSDKPFEYSLDLIPNSGGCAISNEHLENSFHRSPGGFFLTSEVPSKILRGGPSTPIDSFVSVFAEVRHPSEVQLTMVGKSLGDVRLYREFQTGPGTQARQGVSVNASSTYLEEDGRNIARVLGRMRGDSYYRRFLEILRELYPAFGDLYVETSDSGISQVYVIEEGCGKLSATSLSDGTLRLLCLLVVLLDPKPAPLTCIEEPEAGLHPDAIKMLGELLIEASTRTQLIVTTHSPALVDALSGEPESVIVCERDDAGNSELNRLRKEQLDTWLEDYSLGQLWAKGEIGGNRW